ncbi:MAG: restriction endonuclease [Candidatus Omnitrophota bacterium]|nr:restriction endonuclease [Candidatus Omnitrophota bacterium]
MRLKRHRSAASIMNKSGSASETKNWKLYQEEAARFFRELGCIVETDASVQGVRARHDIDVWVRFARFGIQQAWVIECKLWDRRIPKEKVLALKAIVEDVGADRGILIAESGHQRGALAATSSTNITLTALKDLRESAKAELLSLGLSAIFERSARLKQGAHDLFDRGSWSRDGELYSITSRPKPGVDGNSVIRAIGAIGLLQMGIEQAQLGDFPVPLRFDESGEKVIRVQDLEMFVTSASSILDELEEVLASQRPQ